MKIKGAAKCQNCGQAGSLIRDTCQVCAGPTCGFCQSGSPIGAVHSGECRAAAFQHPKAFAGNKQTAKPCEGVR